jgi:uncharacterized protein (TIGR03086 family)
VHGWDLAVATGQQYAADPASLQLCTDFASAFPTDPEQRGDAFGPVIEMPEGAPALDRLLGLMGRDPAWRPAHSAA